MSVRICDPILLDGEPGRRKGRAIVMTGYGQARVTPKMAEFVTSTLRAQDIEAFKKEQLNYEKNHKSNKQAHTQQS